MNENPLRGIEIPIVNVKIPDMSWQNRQLDAISRSMKAKREEEERYKEDTLNTLKNIEQNTGDISQLVSLLHKNSDKQIEILEVMSDIMAIGVSSTEEEAESKYRIVMTKITQTFEDADTMEKLLGYSKMVYHVAKDYIINKIENGG